MVKQLNNYVLGGKIMLDELQYFLYRTWEGPTEIKAK